MQEGPEITERQLECVRLYAQGLNNMEISERLGVTPRTVKSHFDAIRHKYKIGRKKDITLALHKMGYDVYPK